MCVSDRLRELREDCPPLQPYAPVRLWNRSFSPNLRLRGGGTQDGGEEETKPHFQNLLFVRFGPSLSPVQHRVNASWSHLQKLLTALCTPSHGMTWVIVSFFVLSES